MATIKRTMLAVYIVFGWFYWCSDNSDIKSINSLNLDWSITLEYSSIYPTKYLNNYMICHRISHMFVYSISQEICTRLLLCCALLWLHIWLFFPYPSGLLHWHCGNLTIAPVPAKQPWWIWINTSCEFIMNDCITTTKQSTTQPCAYFLGYTVCM